MSGWVTDADGLRFFYKHFRPHHTSVVVPGKAGAVLGWLWGLLVPSGALGAAM